MPPRKTDRSRKVPPRQTPPRQIPMDLAPQADFSYSSFTKSASNADALALVQGWANWPAPVLLLQGPKGSGKTHLGLAWAGAIDGQALAGSALEQSCVNHDAVFIDNADDANPQSLFALINRALAGEIKALLLSSTLAPADWPHHLPDLHSRLKNTAVARLQEADDALLEAVMRKMFDDLGRSVGRDVVDYITARSERSVPSLRALVEALDASARAEKADLTKSYAVRFLNTRPDPSQTDMFEG